MQIMNKAAQRVWLPITAQRLGVLLLVVIGSLAMAVLLYVTALSVSQIRTGAPTAQHRSCATVVRLGCRDAVPDVRLPIPDSLDTDTPVQGAVRRPLPV